MQSGVFAFAVPNGGARDAKTGKKLKAEGVKPGVPDIALVINGAPHFLELKTERGYLTRAQRLVPADNGPSPRDWTMRSPRLSTGARSSPTSQPNMAAMAKHSPKFPAFKLYERTSKNGTRYFLGRLGAMKLIGFLDENAESTNPCWQFYVQQPDDQPQRTSRKAKAEANADWPAPINGNGAAPPPFDDELSDVLGEN